MNLFNIRIPFALICTLRVFFLPSLVHAGTEENCGNIQLKSGVVYDAARNFPNKYEADLPNREQWIKTEETILASLGESTPIIGKDFRLNLNAKVIEGALVVKIEKLAALGNSVATEKLPFLLTAIRNGAALAYSKGHGKFENLVIKFDKVEDTELKNALNQIGFIEKPIDHSFAAKAANTFLGATGLTAFVFGATSLGGDMNVLVKMASLAYGTVSLKASLIVWFRIFLFNTKRNFEFEMNLKQP